MVSKSEIETIWIFHGSGAQFSSGVFTSKEIAEKSIKKYKLSGILSQYPIDILSYDFAVENGYFNPSKPNHFESITIQRFSPPLDHFHYEDGQKC